MNIIKTDLNTCEILSALVDGEVNKQELVALFSDSASDAGLLSDWNAYHLIGDVLRSQTQVSCGADAAFLSRLNQRLAVESLDVRSTPQPAALTPSLLPAAHAGRQHVPASNDGIFRWKLLAGFASVAAVSAVAWNVLTVFAPATQPLAQAQIPVPGLATEQVIVASPQGPMVRDAKLEELLAAHKQMGGMTALPVPTGFLRNATFEAPQGVKR